MQRPKLKSASLCRTKKTKNRIRNEYQRNQGLKYHQKRNGNEQAASQTQLKC